MRISKASGNSQTTRGPDGTLQWVTDWGAYTVDEAALRHGAGVEEETTDARLDFGGLVPVMEGPREKVIRLVKEAFTPAPAPVPPGP